MDNARKFYINGAWVEPSTTDTLDVINPATERPMRRSPWVVLPTSMQPSLLPRLLSRRSRSLRSKSELPSSTRSPN